MLKIKTFSSRGDWVDDQVNEFIKDKKVVNILQSTAFAEGVRNDMCVTVTITVVFEVNE